MRVEVCELSRGEGLVWRDLRLAALAESPDAFGATLETHAELPDAHWNEQIDATAGDPLSTSLIATLNGQPIGMAYCRVDGSPPVGGLYAMWVRPDSRRLGVGRALIDYALAWMTDRGARSAEVTVTENNPAALALYESAGFFDTGRRDPLRDGSPLRVAAMRRDIGEG